MKFFLILLIIVLFYYINYNKIEKFTSFPLIYVKNPYAKSKLKWCSPKNKFCINNFPSNFEWDKSIKEHILKYSLILPKNYGIIDCGAHIGDGTIPIADALISKGRRDITIYAIEPSAYKCDFLKKMAKINNLYNIEIINLGLSDKDNHTYTHAKKIWNDDNTGGIHWNNIENTNNLSNNCEKIKFSKLDTLVKENIITKRIGYLHLDVESMEPEAIQGGLELIKRDKPILSVEIGDSCSKEYKNKIQTLISTIKYIYIERLEKNNIYMHKNKK